jgi:SARP family transcriptional regulator, regulator of embCAB operon
MTTTQIRLLGPVEVIRDGQPVTIRRRQERLLLGALALELGHYVSGDRLRDLVWGGAEPPRAQAALQAMVSHLRSVLVGIEFRITSRGGAYVLEGPAEGIDVHRFRSLVAQARSAATHQERIDLLDRGLAMWRGRALGDVGDQVGVSGLRAGVVQLRTQAYEALMAAHLALGDHALVIDPLGRWAAREPLGESVHALLIRALHLAGRRYEALAVYQGFRNRCVRELGLEPGDEVQACHRAVLRGDLPDCRIPQPMIRPQPKGFVRLPPVSCT